MISNVRRLISRTRTKRTNKSRRLSRKNLMQEGGMKWLTYSKGPKQELIEEELKPLCVKLGLKNSKNQPSINLLKEYIINDDVNFPRDIQGKSGPLKKTITYYLQNRKNVAELIKRLEKIRKSIQSSMGQTGKLLTDHGFLLAKIKDANPEDDDVDEDVNQQREMMRIVAREMDADSSDISDDEREDVNEALRAMGDA
jgi:hypothetical protein